MIVKTTGTVVDVAGKLQLHNKAEGWVHDFTARQLEALRPVANETLLVVTLPSGVRKVGRYRDSSARLAAIKSEWQASSARRSP